MSHQGDIDVTLARIAAAIRRMRLRNIDVEEAYADAVEHLNHLKALLGERTGSRAETLADSAVALDEIERKLKEIISRLPPPKAT